MINVFFDCEFTHLWESHGEPTSLISIGCVTEDGQKFYAENADAQLELCSDFCNEIVLPLLEGGDKMMPFQTIASSLKSWVEGLGGEVKFWSDAPGFDWPHVQDLFDLSVSGWPENLSRKPVLLAFADPVKNQRCQATIEAVISGMRRHHALDDAIANRAGFLRVAGGQNAG